MNVLTAGLLCGLLVSTAVRAGEPTLDPATQRQVQGAEQCVALAYGVKLRHFDADRVFEDCIERRAILIGMRKRYGVGGYGEIDVIDKLEGYNLLSQSANNRVRQEASRYVTASGGF